MCWVACWHSRGHTCRHLLGLIQYLQLEVSSCPTSRPNSSWTLTPHFVLFGGCRASVSLLSPTLLEVAAEQLSISLYRKLICSCLPHWLFIQLVEFSHFFVFLAPFFTKTNDWKQVRILWGVPVALNLYLHVFVYRTHIYWKFWNCSSRSPPLASVTQLQPITDPRGARCSRWHAQSVFDNMMEKAPHTSRILPANPETGISLVWLGNLVGESCCEICQMFSH